MAVKLVRIHRESWNLQKRRNKMLTKEEILNEIGEGVHHPNFYEALLWAMDKWADTKLGMYISNLNSVTQTIDVPKYILDEYARKEGIELIRFLSNEGINFERATDNPHNIYQNYLDSKE